MSSNATKSTRLYAKIENIAKWGEYVNNIYVCIVATFDLDGQIFFSYVYILPYKLNFKNISS